MAEGRKTARLLPWAAGLLLVPAVLMVLFQRDGAQQQRSETLMRQLAEFDAPAHPAIKEAAAKGIVQEVSPVSKAALRNNVKTQLAWSLAEKPPVSSDKVKLTMFMESKCPGSTLNSKECLRDLYSQQRASITTFM
jgi:hypothetical protein